MYSEFKCVFGQFMNKNTTLFVPVFDPYKNNNNTMSTSKCGSCDLNFARKDKMVLCSGECGASFHVHCTKLKECADLWEKLSVIDGIKWFCLSCSKLMEKCGAAGVMAKMLADNIKPIVVKAIEPIKLKLNKGSVSNNNDGSPLTSNIGGKRRRVDKEDKDGQQFGKSYRNNLVFGTNENSGMNNMLKGVQKPSENEIPKDMKYIYLSQLDPSTEPKNIIDYLMELGIIENDKTINCIKLVSPKAVSETYTYVSFKLDSPKDLYDKLIDPDTWPKSVAVREFVHKPRPTLEVATLN